MDIRPCVPVPVQIPARNQAARRLLRGGAPARRAKFFCRAPREAPFPSAGPDKNPLRRNVFSASKKFFEKIEKKC
jgi:hypothetical protein